MGLKQTNLSDKEEKVFNAVKDFLYNQGALPSDTPYVMLKFCISTVCKQTIGILRQNTLGISHIGLTEEDFDGIFELRSRKKNKK